MVADFARMMALLLRSGVPFIDALRLVCRSSNNLVLRDELTTMADAVQRGIRTP